MKTSNLKAIFAKYVSLNVIGMIGLSCYIFADTFFVAQGIGPDGLTSLNLVIPIYSFINGVGLMFGMGGATRYVISRTEAVFTRSICYICFMACIFVLIGAFFSEGIVTLLGADKNIFSNANVYLKVILYFSPMFLLNNVVICFVRNDGNPKLSMAAMLIGSFSNIILDYLFIFPCKMGMFGAALATGIAPVISLLVLSIHFIRKKNTFSFQKKMMGIKGLIDIIRLGISALITEFSSGIVIIIFNSIILVLEGNIGVAAYGIIANIALIVISIFSGIAQGMQPIISLYQREGKKENIKKIVKYGFITSTSVAGIVYAISVIFAKPIVAAFNKEGSLELASIAVNGLRIYFVAFIFVGINILCAAFFSAIDMPKNGFIISVLRGFIVIVPTAFILSALFGINGIWIAMAVAEFFVLIIGLNMMYQCFFKVS